MRRPPIGTFTETAYRGQPVQAFIPNELPPFPPLELDALYGPLDQANAELGRLDAVITLLPEPDLFLYSFVRREAVLSSQIEGTRSSLSDLLLFELDDAPGAPVDDVREVSNYVAALEHGVERIRAGAPLDIQLICDMHAKLLASGRGERLHPGALRHDLTWVGGYHPAVADFVPAPADEVPRCMSELVEFVNDRRADAPRPGARGTGARSVRNDPPVLRRQRPNGALAHPADAPLRRPAASPDPLSQPLSQEPPSVLLPLSRHRATRGRVGSLAHVLHSRRHRHRRDSLSRWRKRLSALVDKDRRRIQDTRPRTGSLLAVHDAFAQRPLRTIRSLVEATRLTQPTVAAAVREMTRLGITDEITGRRRGRVFRYRDFMKILNEDLEPL